MIVNVPGRPLPLGEWQNHGVTSDSEDFVQVYATGNVADGYLVKGRLEAEGIQVLVKGESEGPYRMGPVYLWVPASLEVQARLILESIESGEFDDRTSVTEEPGEAES